MINPQQLDMFESDLATELRETKKWLARVEKKLRRLDLTMQLVADHRRNTKIVKVQMDMFKKAN